MAKNPLYSRIGKAILRELFGTEIYKFHYLEFDTSDCPKLDSRLPFPVKNLKLSDFKTGNPVNFTDEKLCIIAQRLKSNNYKAFGIIENNKLLYSTWVALDCITLPNGKVIPLHDYEAILEDSYCEPCARGRHFHSIMNLYRLDFLASLGKEKVLAIVLDGNEPAMKVQLNSGFSELGTFYSGKILWCPFATLFRHKYESRKR